MNSKKKILEAILGNQPEFVPLPVTTPPGNSGFLTLTNLEIFVNNLKSIGGQPIIVKSFQEIGDLITITYQGRILDLAGIKIPNQIEHIVDPLLLADVELTLIKTSLAVAENGAIWLTDEDFKLRASIVICEHLAVILNEKDIVPDMHAAYFAIELSAHSYGVFIAGPSKTADIEQALVLGAHGPRSMTVFILR